jgi:hypothetical protein
MLFFNSICTSQHSKENGLDYHINEVPFIAERQERQCVDVGLFNVLSNYTLITNPACGDYVILMGRMRHSELFHWTSV